MAEKKFFVDINLQGSALTNATIGTNSSLTKAGSFGFDGTRLKYFDGTAIKDVANLSDISAVTGGLIFQGGYDPTTNTPDITDGTALKGYFWAATAAGTFLGESVQVGDSIVAKVDNAGATIADWLILQGNIVIATDTVDGISRLATQTEANDGTEGGAVVITPATLQGKIDAQITPEISSKLPLAGGTMSGDINMSFNNLNHVDTVQLNNLRGDSGVINVTGSSTINMNNSAITDVATPTNGGDAANKTYVDDAASTAQANAEATASADATAKADAAQAAAEAYADGLAPNYDAAGSAAQALTDANAYTDTGLAAKLNLAGGTMSGAIDMGANMISNVDFLGANQVGAVSFSSNNHGGGILVNTDLDFQNGVKSITNLPAPTANGDAANKEYVDTTASTAESNANAYTDTEIAAQSFSAVIAPEAWSAVGDIYLVEVTHNFNTNSYSVSYNLGGKPAEFYYETSPVTVVFVSNIIPTQDLNVQLVRVTPPVA